MNTKYVIVIILVVLLVLFLAFNSKTIFVNFLIFKVEISTAIVIILSALLGFVIGALTCYTQKKNTHKKSEKV